MNEAAAIGHVAHLVTNDVRMDSRVRRHAITSRAIAGRVSVLALVEAPGTKPRGIDGVEIVRVGRAFTGTRLYRGGRRAYATLARALGEGEDTGARGRRAAAASAPGRDRMGARAKTLLRDRLEARHLDRLGARFVRALDRLAPDVVVCNDLDTLGAGLRHARRRGGVRVVFDAHELWPEHSADRTPWWISRWSRLEREFAVEADARVTVNPSLAEVLSERWAGARVDVVRNALPRSMGHPAPRAARDGGRLEVVYAGGYLQGRGLDVLLDALGTMRRGSVRLTLYGSGELERALRARSRALGLGDDVSFRAPVPGEELIERLASADVGVVPYQGTTLNSRLSTPTKLYEYLAAGLAVAASDLPAIREVVAPEGAGVFFDPDSPASVASALASLASDPAGLMRCREGAHRAFVERYHFECERDVYLAALSPPRSPTR